MEQRCFQIALNVRALRVGEIYTAGAKIYTATNEGKQLEKVASLFIPAKSKRSAVKNAIEALLNEVDESSYVNIKGRQTGRSVRESLSLNIT
jgi:hypothetical protein